MKTREITLEEVLAQREERMHAIEKVKVSYPQHAVISYQLNVPGPIKNDAQLLFAFEAGLKQIKDAQLIVDWRENVTGPEAILIHKNDAQATKRAMIQIENNFPLGRLFDLDVAGIDRKALAIAPRKCLICEEPAHVCSRSRKHDLEEVLEKIYALIAKYQQLENVN